MTSMRRAAADAIADNLRSAAFARAYTLTALTAAFLTTAVHNVNGIVTLAAIVAGLAAVGTAILFVRRDELSLIGFAPTSLALLIVWALASVAWSLDGAQARTIAAWLSLAGWAVVAITIAHVRDTLQIARAMGDVLRWILTASLAVEVLSGIVFDVPFPTIGVEGLIAFGGPVQGLFASRNLLGFVAVLALIAFVIEWRARAVERHIAVYSIALAALLVVLSGSPTALVLVVMLLLAELALAFARRTPRERRRRANIVIASLSTAGFVAALLLHRQIIDFFAARSGFAARADLWSAVISWVRHRPINGWGLFGTWEGEPFPTNIINLSLDVPNASALDTYLDVLLQLGWVGLLLFCAFCAIALVRAWLAAADRRSVVYAWLPLTLVALLVESVFESYTFSDLGWMLLVLCAVRAGRERSWRTRMDPTAPIPPAVGGPAAPQDRRGSAR
ncbi:O-antigen ligase family protein [Microbacterium karelineae]|uniref:O-antigen ligase family protein n=1 Tax=Microbacterium karelineae TaxID=2654283 RepID=UPI001E621723|nr:O-antigen ligase family protein [Microbacterium karelineae]